MSNDLAAAWCADEIRAVRSFFRAGGGWCGTNCLFSPPISAKVAEPLMELVKQGVWDLEIRALRDLRQMLTSEHVKEAWLITPRPVRSPHQRKRNIQRRLPTVVSSPSAYGLLGAQLIKKLISALEGCAAVEQNTKETL